MVEIDPTQKKYAVRFRPKDQRQNKTDDKIEIFRAILGIADTKNILEVTKESDKVRLSEIKKTIFDKDKQTISDINTYQLPVIMARLTQEQYHKIRKDPNVLYVEEEKLRRALVETIPWGITRVKSAKTDMDAIPTKHRGDGVKCAVVDTGIDYNHVDLKPNVKGGVSTVDGVTDFMDDASPSFHGTHVSGSIAATEDNNAGVTGVAPQTWLYGVKFLNSQGSGTTLDGIEALEWCRVNKMHVNNNSWGGGPFSQTEADTIKALYSSGCIILCALGNEATKSNIPHYPSDYPFAWSIGAFDSSDQKAAFSNESKNLKFGAPGVAVFSTKKGNLYQELSGTSMATPHVSGIVSLALANYRINPCNTTTYNPTFNKQTQILQAMIQTADTLGRFAVGGKDEQVGFGVPQADAMVKLLLGIS